MKTISIAAAVGLLVLTSCDGPGEHDKTDLVIPQTAAELAEARRHCPGGADHVVLINDFGYFPGSLTVKVGETVAWVNLEKCGDSAAEQLVTPLSGCDSHHEVVTSPLLSSGDGVDSGPICSPYPGIPGPGVNVSDCGDDGETNVFCHTFETPGTQNYTCFTNPGHTALMHGFITVE
jgi:plastocyanin